MDDAIQTMVRLQPRIILDERRYEIELFETHRPKSFMATWDSNERGQLIQDISSTLRTDPVAVRDYLLHMKRYLEITLQEFTDRRNFVQGIIADIKDHGRVELGPVGTTLKSITVAQVTSRASTLQQSENATNKSSRRLSDLEPGWPGYLERETLDDGSHFHRIVKVSREMWVEDIQRLLADIHAQYLYLRDNDSPHLFGKVPEPDCGYLKTGEVSYENQKINSLVEFGVQFQERWGNGNQARNGIIYRGYREVSSRYSHPMSDSMLAVRLTSANP